MTQVGLLKPKQTRKWLFFGGSDELEVNEGSKEKTLADLWVEFLLQEAADGDSSSARTAGTYSYYSLSLSLSLSVCVCVCV